MKDSKENVKVKAAFTQISMKKINEVHISNQDTVDEPTYENTNLLGKKKKFKPNFDAYYYLLYFL